MLTHLHRVEGVPQAVRRQNKDVLRLRRHHAELEVHVGPICQRFVLVSGDLADRACTQWTGRITSRWTCQAIVSCTRLTNSQAGACLMQGLGNEMNCWRSLLSQRVLFNLLPVMIHD